MKILAAASAIALLLATPVLAQGRDPHSSSGAAGNAEQNNKPQSNSAGGGASGR
ncbi:hypothetical protein [Methylobacterium soli]|jgi:hypothetical protein|uniref:hypothetical protein n=1 Tax=Methylobacterium soli TaxID=553447 RepID=UPI00177C94E3|nr:hypothetical protein [Methylobacterium soli]GJE41806.1 hypothetical protein AEGHOMDF_0972 [Methylobacterium soli]